MWTVSFTFFWVWVAAMILAIWAARIAQRFGMRLPRITKQELSTENLPSVALILPIKGVDDDTQANVQALLSQDYSNYRLIFTVESDDDPVIALLERLAREESRIEIVVAGLSQTRGQKIHNQLAAVDRTTTTDEILAFVDADANPNPAWLHALILPLTCDDQIGATTGYRYFIPMTDHTANKIALILNAQVGALFGPYRRTFAWGGSMAIRRKDFFNYGLHDMWQTAVSDDYVLSHCVKKIAKKKIQFVPQCLVASDANFNWASLFEFVVRQYRITKVCEPWVWLTAIGGAILYLTAFTYTLFHSIYGFIQPAAYTPTDPHWRQIVMFAALYVLSIFRGYMLIHGGTQLWPDHKSSIASAIRWATIGMPWCFFINLIALIGSAVGKIIVWRGVSYKLVSRTKTIVQRPHTASAPGSAGGSVGVSAGTQVRPPGRAGG